MRCRRGTTTAGAEVEATGVNAARERSRCAECNGENDCDREGGSLVQGNAHRRTIVAGDRPGQGRCEQSASASCVVAFAERAAPEGPATHGGPCHARPHPCCARCRRATRRGFLYRLTRSRPRRGEG